MSESRYPEQKERDLFISDRISQCTVRDVIKDIFDINRDDDKKENALLSAPIVSSSALTT